MTKTKLLLSAIAATTLMAGTAIAQAQTVPAATDAIAVAASAETTILASGSWTKKSFKSAGTWSIYEEGGKTFVQLSDDFKTKRAPDLKIFLSPQAAADTNGKNATQGAVLIAPLSSNKGGQTYEVPEGVIVSNYTSILIHCEAYSKLWSASDM